MLLHPERRLSVYLDLYLYRLELSGLLYLSYRHVTIALHRTCKSKYLVFWRSYTHGRMGIYVHKLYFNSDDDSTNLAASSSTEYDLIFVSSNLSVAAFHCDTATETACGVR